MTPNHWMLRALTGTAALALLAAPLFAQDDGEDELTRVRRDQSRLATRLPTLREKMERLASRYEDEGRTRNATLLREALAQYDQLALLDMAREVERSLDQTKLSSIERQDDLLGALEGIYAVLRDRRDVEDLRSQADLARTGVAEMGFLAENQRRLLSETRALTDRPEELLSEAQQAAENLERELQTAAEALSELGAAKAVLGEAKLAAELAQAQRALAGDADATAEAQAMLRAALELLRERLARPSSAKRGELSATVDRARAEAAAAAERASRAMQAAQARLPSADGAAPPTPGEAGASSEPAGKSSPPNAAPTAKPGQSGKPGESGKPGQSGKPGEAGESGESGEQASSESSASAGESGAQGQQAEQGQASESGESGESGEPAESSASEAGSESGKSGAASASSSEQSGKPSSGAQSQAGTPSPPGAPSPAGDESAPSPESESSGDSAREQMELAARDLEQMAAALEQAERAATATRNREQALALAAAREAAAQAETVEDRAERLEALDPDAGPELLDRTRELLAELSRAAPALEQGNQAAAQQSLDQAAMDLAALREMLQNRSAPAEGEAKPEATQAQLDELARRQDELADQTRRLMERLEELPDQQFKPPLERAQQAMQGASEALRRGNDGEAEQREQEAAEELDQAQQELAQDRDRYEQLRQEEVLFQIAEELGAMHTEQTAINDETRTLGEGRDEDGRLGRSQRRALARLATLQSDLGGRTEAVRTALEDDGAIAVVFAVDEIRTDMRRSAELLGDERTDVLVHSVQADVLSRIEDLQNVLAKEEERRRKAGEEQQDQQPQGDMPPDSKVPLVPRVAELYLIQRLEQAALRRLENFEQLNPEIFEGEAYDDVQRQLIERWAFEHVRVTEMFRELVPEQPPQGGEMTAPGLDGRPREESGPPAPEGDDR